jgi:hypothetical protein
MAKKPWEPIISQIVETTQKSTAKKAPAKKAVAKAVSGTAKKSAGKTTSRGKLSAQKKLTRAEKSTLNSEAHWAAREKDLAERAAAKAAERQAKSEQNRAMWREMRSDRDLKREAAWQKYKNKKSKGK